MGGFDNVHETNFEPVRSSMPDQPSSWEPPSRDNPYFAKLTDQAFEIARRTRPATNEEIISVCEHLETKDDLVSSVSGLDYYKDPIKLKIEYFKEVISNYRDENLFDRNEMHVYLAYALFRKRHANLIDDYNSASVEEFLKRRKVQQRPGARAMPAKLSVLELIDVCYSIMNNAPDIDSVLKNNKSDQLHLHVDEVRNNKEKIKIEFRFGFFSCAPAINVCFLLLNRFHQGSIRDLSPASIERGLEISRGRLAKKWLEV